MAKAKKGSAFEREICKQLSLWWTNGERDDVFWRTSSSGGRATQRTKQNKTTFGQYGDVQATDPIGQRLIDIICIELKRGYPKATFSDWFDRKPEQQKRKSKKGTSIADFIEQAKEQARAADEETEITHGWWLIHKRDRREAMLFMDESGWKWICERADGGVSLSLIMLDVMTMTVRGGITYQIPLTLFLESVPARIFAKDYDNE